MQRSIYLAKLIGPVFAAIGIGMLLNGQIYRGMGEQFLSSTALIYLSGLLALPVGIAIVLAHNIWAPDWRVLITLLGWLSMIGGVFRIVYPQLVQSLGGAIFHLAAVPAAGGTLLLVLGLALSFFGYRGTA
ncbi:MAG: hypothetical protein ACREE3_15620 [Stellaceae bacterium]